jgi:hypothetical protein
VAGYSPLYITPKGFEIGLVQNRVEHILPDDAFPVLENAFVYRERIKRRQGLQFLGRLRRILTSMSAGTITYIAGTNANGIDIFPQLGLATTQPNASVEINPANPFTLVIGTGGTQNTLTDLSSNGTLTVTGPGPITNAFIQYSTGIIIFSASAPSGGAVPIVVSMGYFPGLPAMGLRTRELNTLNNEQMVAFDTIYAYRFASTGFVELSPGTTWTGSDVNFFWSTNYWISAANNKLFWVTNFSGTGGDPIRYYDGITWTDFGPTAAPQTGQIDAVGNFVTQALAILPFRGRLVYFNVLEGTSLAASTQFPQRIRWAAIGNPLLVNAWRDDIRGQGGFLDIPTSDNITAVGFVRDNLVVYCEQSTWQLRYTGRSIAPFQIEKVNSELGSSSLFSAVQFDTSLVGIGDKGVVECDSFKSNRIDVKIPDLVFLFDNLNDGPERIHGIRDFQQRLAYWIYNYQPTAEQEISEGGGGIYPNRRLVYNYENDSWAIFTDSLTCLGTFQPTNSISWAQATFPWNTANFPWINRPALFPALVGGNQQGYVSYLGSNITPKTNNDQTLVIQAITGNTTTPTVITSPNHNLVTGQVIQIMGIPVGTSFADLNLMIFGIVVVDQNNFQLWIYNPLTQQFSTPQLDPSIVFPAVYIGGGQILIRDGFTIQSKKFNSLDEGQNIQLGYLDLLVDSTVAGAISLNVLLNYNDDSPINILPQNVNPTTALPDEFFNSIVPTSQTELGGIEGTKYWQRVICPIRGAFITIIWNLSNAQLIGPEQSSDVQIDSQILWLRKAGRISTF